MRLHKSIFLLAIPVLLLGAAAGAWTWLLHSESGARWIFGKLQSSQSFSLGADSISGDLGSGLQLQSLWFENETMRLDITEIETAVNIDLLPPAVNLDLLHSDYIVIRSLPGTEQATEQPVDLRETLQGLSLPVPVYVHSVRLNRVEYIDVLGENLIEVQSVEVSGAVSEILVLDGLAATAKGHDLTLSGQLGLSPPHPLNVQFSTSGELSTTGQLTGTLEQLQFEFENQAPSARISGSLQDVLTSPEWDLELVSPDLRWPINAPEPQARITGLSVQSRGQWSDYTLKLDGSLLVPGLEPGSLVIQGSGDSTAFSAQRISLDGSEFALESQAEVSWKQDLAVAVTATLERLNLNTWIGDWPDNHLLAGDLALEWSGDEIAVPRFSLEVSDTPFVASGNGLFDLPSGIVNGQLNWQALSWPIGAPVPQFVSKQGQFEVAGAPDDWQVNGSLEIQAAEFPQGNLRLSGTGNLESLEAQIHEGAILGGFLAGEATFNWTGNQPFQASLQARDIHTEALFEQYPGTLSADLTTSGQLQPLFAKLDVQRLDGTIRQIPVNASGGIRYGEGDIHADALTVRSGSSSLLLDGNPYQPGGIEFAADIESLSHFSDDLGGTLSTRGRISLDPDSPSISGTLTAQQLKLGAVGIDAIETRQNELVFSGLNFGNNPMDSLTLRFNSGTPLEKLGIRAAVENRSINVELEGSVPDWSDPLGSGWKGHLSGFELSRDQFEISLDQPVALEVNGERFTLQDACLTGSRNAKLCMAASWQNPDEIDFSADLTSIPLSVLELFIETDARFSQVLNGTLNWSQASGANRSGNARIELSPGSITLEGEDDLMVETGPGLFGFEVNNGRLQKGILDLKFPQAGDIDVDFSVTDLREGIDSPIQGNARVDLSDIDFVGKLFPIFDTSEGVIDLDLALSGTITDPAFNGRASVTNGKIENLAYGFSFSDINLTGEVNELDESFLNGSFRAGEGAGDLSAKISFADILSPVIEFELAGENLTVIDVPDLKVIANPDLQFSWRDKTLAINGRLYIPATRLAPSYLPKASVGQSQDVVIVAGELPVVQKDFLQENAIKLQGTLEVELGDEVVVDLDIAQIDVTGKARFNWQDKVIPIASGSFDATGDIQAFGQFLRVTRGRISFPDVPADNPHLNIRAEREIFGNSQIRRAGLMVAGTLKRPVVEAYTVPMTTKERAQTLLVTGSDFNYEQGVGAVDVGMYVLPRLYVSYGIGVFEDGNVLKVRYDLGRGFGVQATSGQRESGLDMSYTIER